MLTAHHRLGRVLRLPTAAAALPGGLCDIHNLFDDRLDGGGDAASAHRALDAVARAHRVPRLVRQVPLEFEEFGFSRAVGAVEFGRYELTTFGAPVRIVLNPMTPDVGFTLLHEIGHLIDHQLLSGRPGLLGHRTRTLAEWRAAVTATETYTELEAFSRSREAQPLSLPSGTSARAHVRYLLQDDEVFARCYSQFIAVRSGNQEIFDELTRAQGIALYEQWSDGDFRPVEEALERAIEAVGWA
jgi:hypothetical protein